MFWLLLGSVRCSHTDLIGNNQNMWCKPKHLGSNFWKMPDQRPSMNLQLAEHRVGQLWGKIPTDVQNLSSHWRQDIYSVAESFYIQHWKEKNNSPMTLQFWKARFKWCSSNSVEGLSPPSSMPASMEDCIQACFLAASGSLRKQSGI